MVGCRQHVLCHLRVMVREVQVKIAADEVVPGGMHATKGGLKDFVFVLERCILFLLKCRGLTFRPKALVFFSAVMGKKFQCN